jgi:hypothetical protein
MATITGAIAYNSVVTVTAASSGDATAIAAIFNGVIFPSISNTAAVAAAVSTAVTITWPGATTLTGEANLRQDVTTILSTVLTLTSPVSITAATTGSLK